MKLKLTLTVLLCLALNSTALEGNSFCNKQKASNVIAFIGVNVIAADKEQVLERQTVIVEGEKIVGIGPSTKTRVPKGALRIDGKGKYLVPGLVDRKKAIDIFELNVESYPKSANAYDSLAEAYLADGRKQLAIEYYEKALEVDPGYPNAKNAGETIKKLKSEKEGGRHN